MRCSSYFTHPTNFNTCANLCGSALLGLSNGTGTTALYLYCCIKVLILLLVIGLAPYHMTKQAVKGNIWNQFPSTCTSLCADTHWSRCPIFTSICLKKVDVSKKSGPAFNQETALMNFFQWCSIFVVHLLESRWNYDNQRYTRVWTVYINIFSLLYSCSFGTDKINVTLHAPTGWK